MIIIYVRGENYKLNNRKRVKIGKMGLTLTESGDILPDITESG